MWNKFKGLNKGLGGLNDIAKKIRTTEEEIEEKAALTEATGLLPKKHADFDMFKEQMLPKMATGGSLKAVRAPPSSCPQLHSLCQSTSKRCVFCAEQDAAEAFSRMDKDGDGVLS